MSLAFDEREMYGNAGNTRQDNFLSWVQAKLPQDHSPFFAFCGILYAKRWVAVCIKKAF